MLKRFFYLDSLLHNTSGLARNQRFKMGKYFIVETAADKILLLTDALITPIPKMFNSFFSRADTV